MKRFFLFLAFLFCASSFLFSVTSLKPGFPGLILWYDAMDVNGDSTVPADGSTISVWTDKSGQGNHSYRYQSAFSNYTTVGATYVQNAGDGLPAIGISPLTSLALGNLSLSKPYTIFIVERYISGGPYGRLLESRSAVNWLFGFWSQKQGFYASQTNVGTWIADATTASLGTWYIHSGAQTLVPTAYFYSNSVLLGSKNSFSALDNADGQQLVLGPAGARPLSDGSYNYSGETSNAQCREILIFNRELDNNERILIEKYLGKKWAITLTDTNDSDGDGIPDLYDAYPNNRNQALDLPPAISAVSSNLRLWLDASHPYATSENASGLVSLWYDFSGNMNHALATTYNSTDFRPTRPKYSDSPSYTQASRRTLRFSGNKFMVLPDGVFPTGNSSYAFFAVVRNDYNGVSGYFRSGSNTENARAAQFRFGYNTPGDSDSNGTGLRHYWFGNDIDTDPGNTTLSKFSVISYSYDKTVDAAGGTGVTYRGDNGSRQNYINGVAQTGQFSNMLNYSRNGAPSCNAIGYAGDCYINNSSTRFPLTGNISEIIIFDSALTVPQIQAINTYLVNKWVDTDSDGVPDSVDQMPNSSSQVLSSLPSALNTVSTNLALWLVSSANLSSVVTDNASNQVSVWFDWSGNQRHALAIDTPNITLRRPTFITNSTLNTPFIRFLGSQLDSTTSQYMTDVLYGSGANAAFDTLLFVLKPVGSYFEAAVDGSGVYSIQMIFADASNSITPGYGLRTHYNFLRNNYLPQPTNFGDWNWASDGDPNNNSRLRLFGNYTPPLAALVTSNFQVLSARRGVSGTMAYSISSSFLRRGFIGDIAEVIGLTSGVTDAQLSAIEDYLGNKYGSYVYFDSDRDGVPSPIDQFDSDPSRVITLPSALNTVSQNLVIYLDPSNPTYVLRNSDLTVSRVYDLSGKQNHFDSISLSKAPTLNTTPAFGNGMGLYFDAGTELVLGAAVTDNTKTFYTPTSKRGLTVSIVAYPSSSVSQQADSPFIFDYGLVGDRGFGMTLSPTYFSYYLPFNFGGRGNSGALSYTVATASVLSLQVSFNATAALFLNHALMFSSSISTLNALDSTQIYHDNTHSNGGPFTLGRQSKSTSYDNVRFYKGFLGPMVVFQEPFVTANRVSVERYLLSVYNKSITTNIYVGSGNTFGIGTTASPFNHFEQALDAAYDNATIYLQSNASANARISRPVFIRKSGSAVGTPKLILSPR